MAESFQDILPEALIGAVFSAPDGYVPPMERGTYIHDLQSIFEQLPPLQKKLLLHYYAQKVSIKATGTLFHIPVKQCSKLLHRSLHTLRKAANPLYRETVWRIHATSFL